MNANKLLLSITFAVSFFCIGVQKTNGQDLMPADSVDVDSVKANHFHFVYIDHEPNTPIGVLCRRIVKMHYDALETGDKLIVYLSNEDTPIISFTNMEGKKDSVDVFYDIIDELQSNTYHEVNSITDNDSIKSLIGIDGSFPLFNEGNTDPMRYASVSVDFYIGSRFWALRYNEKIIASLYVSLQMPYYLQRCPATKLSFNVFKPQGVDLVYSEGKPFGESNLGNINQRISILEY